MEQAYDPLSYENLARSVVSALFEKELSPLPPSPSFNGSGVYAIYYNGTLECYSHISGFEKPIYVGKAVPPGARVGGAMIKPLEGQQLFKRLKEHSESIVQVENLRLEDFSCRHLVVVPVWISLAERFLMSRYQPIWNTVVDGFGNHDPGSGRVNMKRPRWDILHPGRPWASRLTPGESVEDIIRRILSSRK